MSGLNVPAKGTSAHIRALPCKNMSSSICEQRGPRSDCAYAQSDQDLRCPQTESLDTVECFNGELMPGLAFTHVQDNVIRTFCACS